MLWFFNGVVCMKYGAHIAFSVLVICYNPICYKLVSCVVQFRE